ncbi:MULTISPECIES: ABC transporter substrate-binding protein [unclassified Burkholderia]|uniref:ABC transporter substrate-binding protein n=1 Tax=unclassified Burkholderia TaxID=2613784 RepID=UPI000F58D56B|nr:MULTISPECIES: ABC transporter substrate-binding protein [unclassified Burkholderia]RQR69850.1 ABC transporter substrate-binding protein [Burkholderia sp. Bp9012]RQR73343.1 ABC transporter substrate-binding protein [Burkholderia sp. Bp9011]RQR85202.1 ABC transporter substrate-binding protein [Burkholderia sp. Bp9010]RQZ40327.1 ABC transporter substrate-binding protein [Burkholderia sp. Bp9099]
MRKFVASAVLCVLATSTWAADTLRFGIEADYPPFEYKLPSGELTGFDIDIGNAVCAKLKVKCKWIENSFDGLIPALQARKFDAINSAMWATEQREKAIDFTSIIYTPPIRLVARSGSHILPDAESLKGKRIGVQQGGTQQYYAEKKWAPAGAAVITYPSQTAVFADLAAGRIDAALQSQQSAEDSFLKKPEGKDFAFVGGPLTDEKIFGRGVAFGVRKQDSDLKERLNMAILSLKQDGTLDKLAKKYFQYQIVDH